MPLLALSDTAATAGIIVAGVGTAFGSAVVLFLNTRPKPSPPPPPPYTDEQVQAIKTREPALLAFIVELREQIVDCTKRAEAAAAAAKEALAEGKVALAEARAEAERRSTEAKKWQDEVLRLQGLVERLLPDG